jgi:hypothetical protein
VENSHFNEYHVLRRDVAVEEVSSGDIDKKDREDSLVPLEKRVSLAPIVLNVPSMVV